MLVMSSEGKRAFDAREANCSREFLNLADVYTIFMYTGIFFLI